MKVLGLSPLDKDSTVTLIEDGAITYAAAEERFTRVKLQDGFQSFELAEGFFVESLFGFLASSFALSRWTHPRAHFSRRGSVSGLSITQLTARSIMSIMLRSWYLVPHICSIMCEPRNR